MCTVRRDDDVESAGSAGDEDHDMPTVEERLASLEAKVETIADVRSLISELRGDMNARFTEVHTRLADMDARFTRLDTRFGDMDTRFTSLDGRFTSIDARFTSMDGRFTSIDARFTELTGRISSLDAKVDKHFVWLMGMMFTGFISVIGALVGIVYR